MLGVGGALGLPLAGLIGEHADFHALFWITAVAGSGDASRHFPAGPEVARVGGRVDLVGALLLSSGLVALLLPLAEATNWGWTSRRTLILLALSAVLLGALVLVERRIDTPLVDLVATAAADRAHQPGVAAVRLRAVREPDRHGVVRAGARGQRVRLRLVGGGQRPVPAAQRRRDAGARAAGRPADRSGGLRDTLAFGAVVIALGWLMRIVAVGSIWEIVVGTTIVGAGTGIGYAAMPTLINENTPRDELAAANGLNSLTRTLGGSVASAVGGSLLAASTIRLGSVVLPSLGAYRALFAICCVAAGLAAAAALCIPGAPDGAGGRRARRQAHRRARHRPGYQAERPARRQARRGPAWPARHRPGYQAERRAAPPPGGRGPPPTGPPRRRIPAAWSGT